MYKKLGICIVLLGCLLLAGCQETPKQDAIVQKQDVVEQLEENTELFEDDESLREYLEAPETVDFLLIAVGSQVFKAEGVTVTIPEVSGLPSAKMSRYTFDEAYLKKAAKYFFQEADIYKYENPEMTKSDYQSEIERSQKQIEELKDEGEELKDEDEILIDFLKSYIEDMTNDMATAPDTWEPQNEPIEFIFDTDNSFGAMSEVDGSSASLWVVDNEAYSRVSYYIYDPDALHGEFNEADEYLKVKEGTTNRCKYTREEAIALCEDIISELIPDDSFVLDTICDQFDEQARQKAEGIYTITEFYGYSLRFTRQINNVKETRTNAVTNDSAEAYPFDYERLNFRITDKGVIDFSWSDCMQIDEISFNNINVLTFPQIKTAVETNLPIKYADYVDWNDEPYTLNIKEIRLGLMCLRNKNDNISFTIIPVWDVFSRDDYGVDTPVLCLNAIDGSVIDRGLRY